MLHQLDDSDIWAQANRYGVVSMDLEKYQNLHKKDSIKTAVYSHLMQFLETLHELFFVNHILYLLPVICLMESNCYENDGAKISLDDSISTGIFSF